MLDSKASNQAPAVQRSTAGNIRNISNIYLVIYGKRDKYCHCIPHPQKKLKPKQIKNQNGL